MQGGRGSGVGRRKGVEREWGCREGVEREWSGAQEGSREGVEWGE